MQIMIKKNDETGSTIVLNDVVMIFEKNNVVEFHYRACPYFETFNNAEIEYFRKVGD